MMRRATPSIRVTATTARRWYAEAASSSGPSSTAAGSQQGTQETSDAGKPGTLSPAAESDPKNGGKPRNILVYSNTGKALYVHFHNQLAANYWWRTDFHYWFAVVIFLFVGTQMIVRYRVAMMTTVQQAKLGENLLDQRTRDLLSDIETLREKDPLRLENEANAFHELFWNLRAKKMAQARAEVRTMEINRGLMQGEARGTDMTEWLGAKKKDDSEREIARRTHDYIQGFHQHLKAKRLI